MNKRKIVLRSLIALFLLSALGLGCLDSGSTGSSDTAVVTAGGTTGGTTGGTVMVTTGTINITVGSGNKPAISWDGGAACNIRVARIITSISDSTAWAIMAVGPTGITNSISSPVTYGTAPAGTMQTNNDEPDLTPGQTYEVLVQRKITNTSTLQYEVGTLTFTR
ncbi:MAG: hypothetical protein PHX78_04230 [bacterium]|nr:hypothetical protein [bacterium]